MTEIQTALLESYHHWEDNVKSYPFRAVNKEKRAWFRSNCGRTKCPLCSIFNRFEGHRSKNTCVQCPVGPISCFDEYNALEELIEDGVSLQHHVEAVRDRLKAECEKEGLI